MEFNLTDSGTIIEPKTNRYGNKNNQNKIEKNKNKKNKTDTISIDNNDNKQGIKKNNDNKQGIKENNNDNKQDIIDILNSELDTLKNDKQYTVDKEDLDYIEDDDSYIYDIYLHNYPDLRHLSPEAAFKHYNNNGIKEGRNADTLIIPNDNIFSLPKNLNTHGYMREYYENKAKLFNYTVYTHNYPDLKNMPPQATFDHYITVGLKQNREATIYKNQVNTVTNICICIHLDQVWHIKQIQKNIDNINMVFKNVHIIVTTYKYTYEPIIKYYFPDCNIIEVDAKGLDMLPFIHSVKYIRENNIPCDYILKLYTDVNDVQDLFTPINKQKRWEELSEPIMNEQNLHVLQHYFTKLNDIGFVASHDSIIPNSHDCKTEQLQNKIKNICGLFPNIPQQYIDFTSGNIFWISNNILDKCLTPDIIKYIETNIIDNNTYKEKHLSLMNRQTIEDVCQRLFTGVFCFNSTNILINNNECHPDGVSITDNKIDHTYFHQPKVFSFHRPQEMILS